MFDKGLLYRTHGSCRTVRKRERPTPSHGGLGYKEVEEPSVHVSSRLTDDNCQYGVDDDPVLISGQRRFGRWADDTYVRCRIKEAAGEERTGAGQDQHPVRK